ncbi:hypothetical protein PVT71_26930 (plasmid) [Salipiger sp. H15]|uniref:Uncharacterized protein n=1 Tax=Alloyangia sp. H15 TaxID=3029062 RepID=A0AAU8AR29_9RHOB
MQHQTINNIPVISEKSSKEELIRYIRLLEARLEIDTLPGSGMDFSTGLHATPGGTRTPAPQQARVDMLRSGMDAVGLRDAALSALRSERG